MAKGPPKRLNSAAIGMNIYWPNIMFGCCPRIKIDALRPPLLIYASKTRIEIILYWQFYEIKLTEKWKNDT